MNLSKRTLVVIIPVVFLSYCLASISVYFPLADSIKRLEQNRLDLAVTELAASFNQYSTFSESYLHALMESNAFRDFLKEDQNVYREVGLGAVIEKAIRSFKQHHSEKLSFMVIALKPEIKELYYFELSDDPFALPSEALKAAYHDAIESNEGRYWAYVDVPDTGSGNIVTSRIIDRISFYEPVAGQLDNGVLVQFSLEPSQYLVLKDLLQSSYGARINVSMKETLGEVVNRDHDFDGLVSTNSLGPDSAISVVVPAQYLADKLLMAQLTLSAITLIFFIFSSLLLYRLVRKYITAPIIQLECELSEVMEKEKSNITLSKYSSGEVGRLERTFHKLYGELSDSYATKKELAEHDALTTLYNHAFLNEWAQEALVAAQKGGECVALIYIDLDNFKFVNDNYGHAVGDALLKAFASRLAKVVRSAHIADGKETPDTVLGRIAGDEFAVVIRHVVDDGIPERIAKRILGIFQNGFSFEKGVFPVSASIGIAMCPKDGHTLAQLVSNADNAMYQAKNSGKNNIAFYSKALAMKMRRRLEIEHELKTIDYDHEFHLVYMPLVDALTDKIAGFEVLLRWISPKLGFVGPDEFVPLAEASGLFGKLDAWVTEHAIRNYGALKLKLGCDFKLSINLSSAQLNVNLIGDHLLSLTERYQVSPACIQLEMTETLNVEYTQQADTLLNSLCDHGFQIAIDDFGTGYTALLQLLEYPAQMIKFDKTFIDKAMLEDNRSMLQPLISLCHSQNLEVTVEGVETEEMERYLKAAGCDYLQGFYYGKPAKLDDLVFIDGGKAKVL